MNFKRGPQWQFLWRVDLQMYKLLNIRIFTYLHKYRPRVTYNFPLLEVFFKIMLHISDLSEILFLTENGYYDLWKAQNIDS